MNTVDLGPFYRSSVGFDRLASLIDNALTSDNKAPSYPPYNIEMLDENRYAITLALAGYTEDELDIQVEKGVLTVSGEKEVNEKSQYLYHGIASGKFERKFNLAEYVEVSNAKLDNGLLTISLVREIPEAMKPKKIAINKGGNVLEHKAEEKDKSKREKAA
jgi:molecular chaperone IbpA